MLHHVVPLAAVLLTHEASFQQGVQGYSGTQDIGISNQNARWNKGQGHTSWDEPVLGCYRTGGAQGYEVRVLLRFAKLTLPQQARVTAAELTLSFDNWSHGAVLRGHYLRQPFNPASRRLGWRLRDDVHPWTVPGALGPAEQAALAFRLTALSGRGEETHTVQLDPQVVQQWVRRPETNHGLLLVSETPERVVRMYASESPVPARRPRLVIRYELPGVKAAPASSPPSGSAAPQNTTDHPRLVLTGRVLGRLRERARQEDPAWVALRGRCDGYLPGRIEWPDGDDYPGEGNIGEGYQGNGYFDALLALGLCYVVVPDRERAQRYGDKGVELLIKMSEPDGAHAVDPLRDSGYGIRFYGVGLALGYDWLHGALTAAQRERIRLALDRWIDAYEREGFGRDHPQGNYFAGYYATKLLTALATRGEGPRADAHWQDWLERVHLGQVQPYYAVHLRGGGWPEGWNYGPLATLHMSWPALIDRAVIPGGRDLLRDPQAPYLFPIEQGAYLLHFTWPNRRTLDDRHIQYEGNNPAAAQPSLFITQAGILARLGDPLAPVLKGYARQVRAAQPDPVQPWVEFLFWDSAAPERGLADLPRSYLARGMGMVAMRSSWEPDAVWASFTAGPYVNNPASGEQYFDQGSLAVVRGGQPVLVNAPAALVRHRPGTEDGRGYHDLIYNELFHGGNRRIFNIFYIDQPRPYGQAAVGPQEARTRVGMFADGGEYVLARGDHLEDMYRKGPRGARLVVAWTRTLLYLRPAYFLIYDETEIADGDIDQWMAFHLAERPNQEGDRFLVGGGDPYRGAVVPLLPAGVSTRVVDLFQRGKVFRLEIRPPAGGATQRWLTAVDAGAVPTPIGRLSAQDGSVRGSSLGARLGDPRGPVRVVLFCAGEQAVSYRVPAGPARHLLVGLPPRRAYAVRVSRAGGALEVSVVEGSGLHTSEVGVLAFRLGEDGRVRVD
ncbi:MAG: DNRLRE domain-containing protein [Myxococcales bacterium]|nr:DNRLRE domain-containing protein [Myxococcales bacterium]